MFLCTFEEMKNKEVINISNGCRMGYVTDIEFDASCGKILAIIVPGEIKYFGFGCKDEYRILWEDINKISKDVILVCGNHISQVKDRLPARKKKC